ncbi:hypothetical protein [Pararhizobium sp. A13]|uniref:hypothetical protein n=1 Tax=Pararhizobium sp. A13 TaxID=3133975 RepID=UPI00311B3D73
MALTTRRIAIAVMLALSAAACQTEDKKAEPRFVSDARPAFENKDSRYFIEFRSRYALSYGHSYVIFGRADQAGGMIDPEVAGLAPATASTAPYVLGHFLPVPAETGASDGDLEEAYRSASWRVMLTEAQYGKTVAHIRQLKAKSKFWQASIYNCNAFVADIARSMGYKAPSIWLRPQQFITQLREMNAG